jgi:ABC-type uncharacterized transport system auxiliary subunit
MRRREWFGLPLVLGACSVLPERPYQQTRNWPLIVPPPVAHPAPAGSPVLLLRPVRAAAGVEPRGLLTLQADPFEQWIAPPADAVTDQLQRWLTASGRFSAVVAPGSRLTANYVLEAELTALWAVPASGEARAGLSFVLIDQRGGATNALLQANVSGVAPLANDAAETRAATERVALADAFSRLVAALPAKLQT